MTSVDGPTIRKLIGSPRSLETRYQDIIEIDVADPTARTTSICDARRRRLVTPNMKIGVRMYAKDPQMAMVSMTVVSVSDETAEMARLARIAAPPMMNVVILENRT